MTGRRGLLWLVAGLALALLAGRWLAGVYADRAFLRALGAEEVWRAAFLTRGALRLGILSAVFAFAFANFFAVRQSIISLVLPRKLGNLEIPEAIPTRRLTFLALSGALLVATLFSLVDQDWTVASQAFHGLPFVETEPYLERDLGFFVHWLPFERVLFSVASVLLLLTSVIVIALYASTPSVRWSARGLYVSAWVRRHVGVLGGLAIALVSWSWRLDRFALLREGTGAALLAGDVAPFSAYDHRVLMPWLLFTSFLALPLAVVFSWALWRGYLRLGLALVTMLVLAGPVGRALLPLAARPYARAEQALARERPYAATRTLYSRRAYGVDRIARPDRARRVATAEMARWVSSWDPAALSRYLERERRGTDLAAFAWQSGLGGLEAVLLRAAPADAPPGTRWPLDRLNASAVDAAGLPVAAPGLGVSAVPGVLIEPGAARYALVADTAGRLAAPPFESSIERVAQAWDQQNPRLLAAETPRPRPRLVTHRDVASRIARVAPFLRAGPTITPIVRGDSLYWVSELFAVSREYPLSERLTFAGERVHYVQHAATAVVQAQTGRVMLLPVDSPDPVTRSWMQRFPGLFTPRAEAPRWLAQALPPAADWALVQGGMLGRTGFLGDTLPIRALARVDDADADLTVGPATLFQLDSAGTLAWGVPVVGASDAIAGLLTVSGGTSGGTEFVRAPGRVTWSEVLERLQGAADEAGFGRSLPHARRGRVQAIPAVTGPVYAQAFYEWSPDGPPRLAGVAILAGDRTAVGRSLAEALGLREDGSGRGLPVEVFRARVAALYDAMSAALRVGDWRTYGEAWAALGRLLGRPIP
jgi:uncharacterized protein